MSSLFETQNEVTEEDCVAYAQNLVRTCVKPTPWQGYHSYTLLSGSGLIVQFRSKSSPFNLSMTALAKAVHGHIAPATSYHGLMPDSSVSVWIMEALPGTGYLFTYENITVAKLDTLVIDLAKISAIEEITYLYYKFYASSWKNPQPPTKDKSDLYKAQLTQLSSALPDQFSNVIERTYHDIDEAFRRVPWVLTHQDLSNMNILVDPDSGHLTGVVDWADASIEPFGIVLWGLESVLGCSGPHGWAYHEDDVSHSRGLFLETLVAEIGGLESEEIRRAVEVVRTLGLLLGYGFRWEDGTVKPARDTTLLEVFLQSHLFE